MIDTEKLLLAAKEAALEAGEIHLSFFGKNNEIAHKLNEFDLVTNIDKMSEERIISIINCFCRHFISLKQICLIILTSWVRMASSF